jgi:hypothetical protein
MAAFLLYPLAVWQFTGRALTRLTRTRNPKKAP